MMVFTDGSAQHNPGRTGSGVVIKNPGCHSSLIKFAKAITSCGTSYEGEIKAIKLGTDYVFQNIGQANSLFTGFLCLFIEKTGQMSLKNRLSILSGK